MASMEDPRWWTRLPVLAGVRPVDRRRVPAELLAGLTLAAVAIPEVMGYSRIAGMPVITGLYTILLPLAAFAVIGSSRHLSVGADSATAAVMAAGLGGLAVAGSRHYVALAGALALIAAVFLVVARIIRIGFLADFLSRTVLIGFLTGVGIEVAIGQVAGMLGLPRPPWCGLAATGYRRRWAGWPPRSTTCRGELGHRRRLGGHPGRGDRRPPDQPGGARGPDRRGRHHRRSLALGPGGPRGGPGRTGALGPALGRAARRRLVRPGEAWWARRDPCSSSSWPRARPPPGPSPPSTKRRSTRTGTCWVWAWPT